MDFKEFREKYSNFCYEDFTYSIQENQLEVIYKFSIDNVFFFSPKLLFPKRSFYNFELLNTSQLEILLFNIGLVELISYWKCTCSPNVYIKPFFLTREQIGFWKKLYFNGLGEFFYLNKIHTTREEFMNIVNASDKTISKQKFNVKDETIVPIGGGKDSVVTLELLRYAKEEIIPLIINPRGATTECAQIAGFSLEHIIEVKRSIDPKLLELNAAGFLNGHTPFSAMLAFVSLLCAAITRKKHIALSNESSANESTVKGLDVNHQYSKSFEFETDFREYVTTFISDDFNYFSFLRPLNELQIAKLFSLDKKYFKVFKSCNSGSKENIWCGSCSKCLFVYIILSPFIEPKQLQEIFGKNLFQDTSLLLSFQQLIGEKDEKPFECVGTIKEVNTALQLTIQTFYNKQDNLPFLITYYLKGKRTLETSEILDCFDEQNFLQPKYQRILKEALAR